MFVTLLAPCFIGPIGPIRLIYPPGSFSHPAPLTRLL